MTKFLFLTTSIYHENNNERQLSLLRLIESIKNSDINYTHHILIQRSKGKTTHYEEFISKLNRNSSTIIHEIDSIISLSKARNILLHKLNEEIITQENTIVAFPDDDAWYKKDILQEITSIFEKQTINVFICRYGEKILNKLEPKPLQENSYFGIIKIIDCISSITVFTRYKIIKEAGYFDENLGVGAKISGGEDLDYFLRVLGLINYKKSLISDRKHIWHRDRIKSGNFNYYQGSLIAIRKNYKPSFAFTALLIRKYLIGVLHVLKGNVNIFELIMMFKRKI